MWPFLRRLIFRRVPKHTWWPVASRGLEGLGYVNIDDRVHVFARLTAPRFYIQVVAHTKGASHGEWFTANSDADLDAILTKVLDP